MKMKTFRGTETVLAKYVDVLTVNYVLLSKLILVRVGPTCKTKVFELSVFYTQFIRPVLRPVLDIVHCWILSIVP
jgi:hypothetical protein